MPDRQDRRTDRTDRRTERQTRRVDWICNPERTCQAEADVQHIARKTRCSPHKVISLRLRIIARSVGREIKRNSVKKEKKWTISWTTYSDGGCVRDGCSRGFMKSAHFGERICVANCEFLSVRKAAVLFVVKQEGNRKSSLWRSAHFPNPRALETDLFCFFVVVFFLLHLRFPLFLCRCHGVEHFCRHMVSSRICVGYLWRRRVLDRVTRNSLISLPLFLYFSNSLSFLFSLSLSLASVKRDKRKRSAVHFSVLCIGGGSLGVHVLL